MSIYKFVAFILVFIIILTSLGGVVLFTLSGNNQIIQNTTSSSVSEQITKLEFETLELAKTEQERQVGYMNRQSIRTKCGMLFVFEQSQPLSFWMKNTLVPLKITFIDQEGKVINTGFGEPKATNPTVNSLRPAKYVLEVPTDSPVDLQAGQIVDIDSLIAAGVAHSTVKESGNFK
jgi:uncharacterized protein